MYKIRVSERVDCMRIWMYCCVAAVGLFFGSCTLSGSSEQKDSFAGNWQGSGIDSQGNKSIFAAKVMSLGGGKYRVLILDKIDTLKEPMHIMDGELKGNDYQYTADAGMYVGGGTLDGKTFKGYYKGPVDGTFTMYRMAEENMGMKQK